MSTKSPECWANEPQAHGLRVEITADYSILLPHDEFVFAELKRDGVGQALRLVFVTHEVLVSGQSLRRIETAMQRSELSLLTKLPHSQRSLVADGQPVIIEIVMTETKDAEIQSNNDRE
ncbi:MAG TPA: hypothetical protein VGO67_17865 [Verrucomicrobiae bacterium]|jgi:hypothetical protein